MLELMKVIDGAESSFAIVETFKTCEGPRYRVVSRFGNEMAARRELDRLRARLEQGRVIP